MFYISLAVNCQLLTMSFTLVLQLTASYKLCHLH